MKMVGSFAALGLLLLALRAAVVLDVAAGYQDCQLAILSLNEPPHMQSYQERQVQQRRVEGVCHVAQAKAELGQAVLAPATLRD